MFSLSTASDYPIMSPTSNARKNIMFEALSSLAWNERVTVSPDAKASGYPHDAR